MTNTPNSGTVSVSRELLPCPFCGGNAEVPDHADDCYFTLSAQLKKSSASDCSLVPAVLRAWNKRAQPADQQGEPVAWMDPRSPDMHATISHAVKQHNGALGGAASAALTGYCIPLYRHAQPATAKVVLPERRAVSESARDQEMCANAWNACLDATAKLNGIEP